MSDTPLSDAMADHAHSGSQESYQRFLDLFGASTVGIVAVSAAGTVEQGRVVSDGNLAAGRTTHGDGQSRVLVIADPRAPGRKGGFRVNADLPGEVVLGMAADDSECDGVLVNSAVEDISIIVGRSTATSLLQRGKAQH